MKDEIRAGKFELVDKTGESVKATLEKRGYVVNGDFPYPLYSLETRIQWKPDPEDSENQKEMKFKVYQIDFLK